MNEFFAVMALPLFACVILTGIHVYLGLHVVERQVIFVDLALAQVAVLGACTAFLFNHDLHGPMTYWFSLAATMIGAIVFSLSRSHDQKVPQEATIGIVYAMASAAAVLILSRSPEGDEHIRYMLVGNILLVSLAEILKMAVLYSVIGFLLWRFHGAFIRVSSRPQEAFAAGMKVKAWDLFFYLLFGVVVTSSVEIAGVLMVFSILIVPAVAAMLFVHTPASRLLFGWAFGTAASFTGILLSFYLDLPTGAAVVCSFGIFLIFALAVKGLLRQNEAR